MAYPARTGPRKQYTPKTYAEILGADYVYHSGLRDVTDETGGYAVVVLGTDRTPKGDSALVVNPVGAPHREQRIIADNAQIAGKFARLGQGEGYTLRAYGSKAGAAVRIYDAAGNELELAPSVSQNVGPSPLGQAPGQGQGQTPGGNPGTAGQTPGPHVARDPSIDPMDAKLYESLVRAKEVVDAFHAKYGTEPNEAVRTLGTSIFIERNRKGT